MGGIGGTFSTMSWLAVLGGAYTLYQLSRGWPDFWNRELSPKSRQLAGGVAFFLLVPIGVLLHEFGHMLAAWSTSSTVLGLHYFVYWGYVSYVPSSDSAVLAWYVALAGNFVSFVLGVICLAVALRATQIRAVARLVLAQLGVLELTQTLIFYPLISLDPQFDGDWDAIYSFGAPLASWATAIVHAASLVAFTLVLRKSREANWLLRG
ncbi:MAG TPA: hypothetical protein VM409_00790 [Chloroflexia bacterium]|nr:hypothetical protein [Chloroflexia bacterium]